MTDEPQFAVQLTEPGVALGGQYKDGTIWLAVEGDKFIEFAAENMTLDARTLGLLRLAAEAGRKSVAKEIVTQWVEDEGRCGSTEAAVRKYGLTWDDVETG